MAQRNAAWVADRLGRVTASRFGDAMARRESKRYRAYFEELVDERIGLVNLSNYVIKPWFEHGIEMEPRGLAALTFYLGALHGEAELTPHPDFVAAPKGLVGCSPDLLAREGSVVFGAELKCRISAAAQLAAISSGLTSNYRPQVQGCMWVTGAPFWYYASYTEDPQVPAPYRLHVERIERDEAYIARLSAAVLAMDREVEVAALDVRWAVS